MLDSNVLLAMAALHAYTTVFLDLAFPDLRLDREFLKSEFPTLAAYN